MRWNTLTSVYENPFRKESIPLTTRTTTKFLELQNQNKQTLALGIFENLEPFFGALVWIENIECMQKSAERKKILHHRHKLQWVEGSLDTQMKEDLKKGEILYGESWKSKR